MVRLRRAAITPSRAAIPNPATLLLSIKMERTHNPGKTSSRRAIRNKRPIIPSPLGVITFRTRKGRTAGSMPRQQKFHLRRRPIKFNYRPRLGGVCATEIDATMKFLYSNFSLDTPCHRTNSHRALFAKRKST